MSLKTQLIWTFMAFYFVGALAMLVPFPWTVVAGGLVGGVASVVSSRWTA
jgi:hypothetical protein